MKKIDTHTPHPERAPYVRINHPLCDWIYVPTSGEYIDAIEGTADMGPVQRMEHVIGATVRLCWNDHHRALESTDPRDVYREIYRSGASQEAIGSLYAAISEAITKTHTSEQEVVDAADFSAATPPTT